MHSRGIVVQVVVAVAVVAVVDVEVPGEAVDGVMHSSQVSWVKSEHDEA